MSKDKGDDKDFFSTLLGALEKPAFRPGNRVVSLKLNNPLIAEVAPDPRLLEPAKRSTPVLGRRAMCVEVGVSGLQMFGQGHGAVFIGRPYG